jgi:Polyketide cyclase / dehydrase and lipid transport
MAHDELRHSHSIAIARPPAAVYDMVSDVTRMGEWSPTCTGCWWDHGDGPRTGSWFTGRNERDGREWQTRSLVRAAVAGRWFAFIVGGTLVRWDYKFEPAGSGARVTESWRLLPDGVSRFIEKYGPDAATMIADRSATALNELTSTLAALKAVAERPQPGGPDRAVAAGANRR